MYIFLLYLCNQDFQKLIVTEKCHKCLVHTELRDWWSGCEGQRYVNNHSPFVPHSLRIPKCDARWRYYLLYFQAKFWLSMLLIFVVRKTCLLFEKGCYCSQPFKYLAGSCVYWTIGVNQLICSDSEKSPGAHTWYLSQIPLICPFKFIFDRCKFLQI